MVKFNIIIMYSVMSKKIRDIVHLVILLPSIGFFIFIAFFGGLILIVNYFFPILEFFKIG